MTLENKITRVDRGAKLLDKMIPKWWTYIDTNKLDIRCADNCILGQLLYKAQNEEMHATAVSLWIGSSIDEQGFDVSYDEVRDDRNYHYTLLKKCWLKQIDNRKEDSDE